MSTSTIAHKQVTALGDTIDTVHTYDDVAGTFLREDITITGPPELLSAPMGGGHGHGRDIYQHAERAGRPEREIWHEPGRYYP